MKTWLPGFTLRVEILTTAGFEPMTGLGILQESLLNSAVGTLGVCCGKVVCPDHTIGAPTYWEGRSYKEI